MKPISKLLLMLTGILCGSFASCSTEDEPQVDLSTEQQRVIDMFLAEGFVAVENGENVESEELSLEEAEEFLAQWKETMLSIKANTKNQSRANNDAYNTRVNLYKSGSERWVLYEIHYDCIDIYLWGENYMRNFDKIDPENVDIVADLNSFIVHQDCVSTLGKVFWEEGFNKIRVSLIIEKTLTVAGITWYQGTKYKNVLFKLDFSTMKVDVTDYTKN